MGAVVRWVQTQFVMQRAQALCWTPVCLAWGVGLYFALRKEPVGWVLWACALCGLTAIVAARWMPPALRWAVTAMALVATGVSLAGARAHLVAAPVLSYRYYGPVEGTVLRMDRSASDAIRLTLSDVRLDLNSPTPARVRVSLHGAGPHTQISPGKRVMMTAHLSPPRGAVEPGGFDFRRHAWFLRLGAVGYSRTPVMAVAEPPRWHLGGLRWHLQARVTKAIPGEAGAVLAVLLTGMRSSVRDETVTALRQSNLAHLLAISGLHMGLFTGAAFFAARLALVLVPGVGARWPVKRIAAAFALCAGAGYLALSGGSVATQRAFVMAAVALVAVMLHRRVLSLRAVAMAATIVLISQPEALLGPGFQMSFAATTALVAVFSLPWMRGPHKAGRWQRLARGVFGVVISSAVAGAATAPVAMAHFNRFAEYGLIANILAVPVMGAVVMPAVLAAVVLMPLGAEDLPLQVAALGVRWILIVAHEVSSWPAATLPVIKPNAWVLPLMAMGGLWMVLWQGWGRVLGLVPAAVALVLWLNSTRPDILIAEDGGLVGVMTEQGRALSRERGNGFVAQVWLENDGSGLDQPQAAQQWPKAAGRVIHIAGKRAAKGFAGCQDAQIVVTNVALQAAQGCIVLGPDILAVTGAQAGYLENDDFGDEIRFVTERDISGVRLWSPLTVRPKDTDQ